MTEDAAFWKDLRPLSLGELLDRTFTLYRSHFWLFVGIMVPVQALLVAASVVQTAILRPVMATPPAAPDAQILFLYAQLGKFLLYSIPVLLVGTCIHGIALGAIAGAVSQVYLGREATILSSYRDLRGRILNLVGLFLLFLAVISLVWIGPPVAIGALIYFASGGGTSASFSAIGLAGLILLPCTALAVWIGLRYSVAIPALVLEKLGPWSSLRRSVKLTVGHRGRLFLVWLLMAVISYASIALFQGPFLAATAILYKHSNAPQWLRALSAISAGLGGVLTGPMLLIALSLMYYDIRVRKEALDLQMMFDRVASSATSAGEAPPALSAS